MPRNKIACCIISSSFLLLSRAVREAPPGGPEDKIPPNIVKIQPDAGATSVATTTTFTIAFSKPMRHIETENAIFLSPVFWNYPTKNWSGNKLTIIPPEPLKQNKTYILTVGAGAIDTRGNKMGNSYSFAFSTGPVIDTGSISGAIFSEEKQRVTYDIWAYILSDSAGLDFWSRIPDYATQVDSTGGFKISNIGNGKYLVIAVDDRNDDLFWDPSAESMGLPPAIIQLTTENQISGVVLRPARRDTAVATFSSANPDGRQVLEFSFSQQPKKKLMLSSTSYKIQYSDSASALNVLGVYQVNEGKVFVETDPQEKGGDYRLIPAGLYTIWGVPFDTAGIKFTGVDIPDTIPPKLLTEFPSDRSMWIYEDSVVEMTFSEHIQPLGFAGAVNVVADSVDTLKFLPIWIYPNQVRLRFPSPIPRERVVRVILAPRQIRDSFNNAMRDSILTFSFRLPPDDTVGTVNARIEGNDIKGPLIGIIIGLEKQGRTYSSVADKSGKLTIESIMPGNYRFEFFEDADSNGEWSPGVVSPFVLAERFSFLPDTLKVRSRWSTDIGTVQLPNFNR